MEGGIQDVLKIHALGLVHYNVRVTHQHQLTDGTEAPMQVDVSRIWEAEVRVSYYSSS